MIFISSELEEILGMSDRIYVVNEGRIVGEFKREEATQEGIMACILKSSGERVQWKALSSSSRTISGSTGC